MKKFSTVIIMPYLPLKATIKIDNLILWSFKEEKDKYIQDINLKTHIQKILNCYQHHNHHPIDNPTIVSIDKINFANPKIASVNKIEALKNILVFASVLEINSWSFMTSDNFEVIYQRFNVGDTGISTKAGAIHSITTGGYKLDQIAFIKPEHVNIPLSVRFDASVIKALENCLKNQSADTSKNQIIQSLNPFFNAYRNSHETSFASRILLMVMSFELLFGETGRKQFRDNIQKYSLFDSAKTLPTYSYPIINTETGAVTRQENLTLNQIWAEEFYKLRHKIIHGNTVSATDFAFADLLGNITTKNPHFYISVNFYVVCLLNKLKELGFPIKHFIINPNATTILFQKRISGINNETFKIEQLITL